MISLMDKLGKRVCIIEKADKKGDRKGQRPELTDEQKAQLKEVADKLLG